MTKKAFENTVWEGENVGKAVFSILHHDIVYTVIQEKSTHLSKI